jgi:hypothetical protein
MDDQKTVQELAAAVTRLLQPHLRQSEPLRQAVGLLGQWLIEQSRLAAAPPLAGAPATPPETSGDGREDQRSAAPAPAGVPAAATPQRPGAPVVSATVELRLGDAMVPVAVAGTAAEVQRAAKSVRMESAAATTQGGPAGTRGAAEEADLALMARRCKLQAEACAMMAEGVEGGTDAAWKARRDELIGRAKLEPHCFLWAFRRQEYPLKPGELREIAACYQAHAEATMLAARFDQDEVSDPTVLRACWGLLAEANSALAFALANAHMQRPDPNQEQMHFWLRGRTAEAQIFLPRHMSLKDPADPQRAEQIRREIAAIGDSHRQTGTQHKGVAHLLKKIAYHAGHLRKNPHADPANHWSRIESSIHGLADAGVPVSDPRITESIGGDVLATLNGYADPAGPLGLVLQFHQQRQAAAERPVPEVAERAWSESVQRVRAKLEGGAVVVIGGERRQEAVERLTEAFGLGRLDWVELTEHGTSEPMRAPISREDVRLVLVIIRLTGHLHAEEARACADAAGKPWVMLEAGYNPERVANDVLEQAGERLAQRPMA